MARLNKGSEQKISCIIPAYNEAERISGVLSVIADHPLIDETIVVNDASTDKTWEVIKRFKGIKAINIKSNVGKSRTIYRGIKEAKHDLLMLIDADLVGLTKDDITRLINPILKKEADISISLRGNAPILWRIIGLDFITGERFFKRNLITDYEELLKLPGFGLEAFINRQVMSKRSRIKVVRWPGVQSPFPQSKIGIIKGSLGFVRMISQVMKTTGLIGAIRQIRALRSLRV